MPRRTRAEITRIIIALLLMIAAITIASLTVGRDIYYGSRDEGMLSFAIVNACGYLFFLFMPVEVAFVYYIQGDISIVALNAVAIGTALFSQSIDYSIGYLMSNRFIDNFIGRNRYVKAEKYIEKYGNVTIFVFNALPLSSPVISLAAGMLRHRIADTLIFTILGLAVKYLVMTLIF
ncbi:MAG: VTT domain-containing protein [Bacteroidales bacterium]